MPQLSLGVSFFRFSPLSLATTFDYCWSTVPDLFLSCFLHHSKRGNASTVDSFIPPYSATKIGLLYRGTLSRAWIHHGWTLNSDLRYFSGCCCQCRTLYGPPTAAFDRPIQLARSAAAGAVAIIETVTDGHLTEISIIRFDEALHCEFTLRN